METKIKIVFLFLLGLVILVTGLVLVPQLNAGQLPLGLIIFFSSMLVGLAWKLLLDHSNSYYEITWKEFLIAGVIIGIVFSVIGVNLAWKIAWNSRVKFNEYWNGWELEAIEEVTVCTRDGRCNHTYSCDPYLVTETYTHCEDGECEVRTRTETKYHSCPYVTEEYTYLVSTTLGEFVIDGNVFAMEPVPWRRNTRVPKYVQKGPSQFWVDAQERCQSGNPGPVTTRMKYQNLLLASDTTILREYSDQIGYYLEMGLLPDIQSSVREHYLADKVYFVNSPIQGDETKWKESLALLNAGLGTELQGDVHLVIIRDSSLINPDSYITALKAYWQDPSVWGKNTASKNTIIIVIATEDGETVSWARATTGMPIGNEMLTTVLQRKLKGVELTPEAVIGDVSGEFYHEEDSGKLRVRLIGEKGVIRRTLWGLDNPSEKFTRVSMIADDEGDEGVGFTYLASQIKPLVRDQVWIVIIFVVLSSIVWFCMAHLFGERQGPHKPYTIWY